MNKLLQKNKKSIVFVFWLIPFVLSLTLFSENILRASILTLFLIAWLFIYHRSENKVFNSLLFLIFITSFNITLTLGDLDTCYKHNVFVNYLCPTLHIIDIFLILTLIVAILHSKIHEIIKYVFILLPLLTYTIIHTIAHPNINTLINSSRLFLVVSLLVLLYSHIKVGILNKRAVFITIISTLLIQVIISIFQFLLKRDLGLQFLGESTILAGTINSSFVSFSFGEYLRAYGTFPHPNALAGFALALVMFSFKVFNIKDWRLILISLLAIIITMLTLSRLHIVLLGIFLLIQTLLYLKDRYFSFFPILLERFLSLGGNSVSIKERIILMNESFRIIKENWVLGVGSGEFVRYLDNNVRTNSNISLFQPVHNIPMLIITEQGIFGALTYLLYFLFILFRNNSGILQISIILVILVSIGMFDHYLVTLPQGLIIFLLFLL